jgi:hypothetical protein
VDPRDQKEGKTDYVQLLNALMHPDERHRLTPHEALNDPNLRLLQEPILPPEKIRAVFDKINAKEEEPEVKYDKKSKEALQKMNEHAQAASDLKSASAEELPEKLRAYRDAIEYVGELNKELNNLKGQRSALQKQRDKLDKALETERKQWQTMKEEYIVKQKLEIEKRKKKVEENNTKIEVEAKGANDPSAIKKFEDENAFYDYEIDRDEKEVKELEQNSANYPATVMRLQIDSKVNRVFIQTEEKLAEFNKSWLTDFENTVEKMSAQLADMHKIAKERATGTKLPDPPQK